MYKNNPNNSNNSSLSLESGVVLERRVMEGVSLRLRPITPDDYIYIYGLQADPALSLHLSAVRGTALEQRDWILRYKKRESRRQEVYYIVERLDDCTACGTVRIYDIHAAEFTWGSWILDHNKTHKAALESAILIYTLGFCHLRCERAIFDVRRDNQHTLAFHRRFGAQEIYADNNNVYFEYMRDWFEADLEKYRSIVRCWGKNNV
jgi:RimJ/RimL family protein N-acetyltransferase